MCTLICILIQCMQHTHTHTHTNAYAYVCNVCVYKSECMYVCVCEFVCVYVQALLA